MPIRKIEIPKYRRPSTPGHILRDMFLGDDGLNVTQKQLADRLGISRQNFNAVLNGKRAVTTSMAMRLQRVLGVDAQTWMNLQLAVDMYDAVHSAEAKRIAKLKPLTAA
ncbi:MAG: addiction module antidote protein, HigA family [Candidatus Eremiobacter antarcticus]|nr:HigA family addiction module antidote protein [Candidatus Eremiobacteraeota bacterium]MBC5807459.1 HigA family addiction module antidote protein [Candidatus Eremiobacteraeota bacterium]PZR61480.1 MAG: addiction module antidote protein, HigA family [Candidatus Eremiobacter sp. RRmetagenome_bin22]